MKALIDGDIIVYQGGFASDQQTYICADGHSFQYKKDANAHSDVNGQLRASITKIVTPEPVEYCLSSVKKMINGIKEAVDADEYLVLLTGKGNFREKIFPDYKKNRDKSHRPTHYAAIREYLIKHHNADEVIGVEADDALGWHQYKDIVLTGADELDGESCICTIDKDLNQIPGWHYNWRADDGKGAMYWITPDEADRFFFHQWLVGDAADNIPGITRVGDKTATKMFAGEFGTRPTTAEEQYEFVMDCWSGMMPKAAPHHVHMIGDLLWMQRNPGETWDMYHGLMSERKNNEAKV